MITVETTESLTTAWVPTTAVPTIESQGATTDTLTVRLPNPNGTVFVRLRAQLEHFK